MIKDYKPKVIHCASCSKFSKRVDDKLICSVAAARIRTGEVPENPVVLNCGYFERKGKEV